MDGSCLVGRVSGTFHGTTITLAILAHLKNGQQLATNFHAVTCTTKWDWGRRERRPPPLRPAAAPALDVVSFNGGTLERDGIISAEEGHRRRCAALFTSGADGRLPWPPSWYGAGCCFLWPVVHWDEGGHLPRPVAQCLLPHWQ